MTKIPDEAVILVDTSRMGIFRSRFLNVRLIKTLVLRKFGAKDEEGGKEWDFFRYSALNPSGTSLPRIQRRDKDSSEVASHYSSSSGQERSMLFAVNIRSITQYTHV